MFSKNIISKPLPISPKLTKYETNIVEWLKPVIDLEGWYVYPVNGVTEGLTYWQAYTDIILSGIVNDLPGEYEWVESQYLNLSTQQFTHYVSCPSAVNGNFIDLPTVINDNKIALDIAYVGSTSVQHIELTNQVTHVFYSLSKAFGLNGVRTGWMFTRRPDIRMHKMKKLCYYNHNAHKIAEEVIKEYPIDYSFNKYRDQQLRICDKFNFEPSDCVWLGLSNDDKYKEYFRKGTNTARICLTNYYDS